MSSVSGPQKLPFSRGIPSKIALKFVYDDLPMSLEARWEAKDVLALIFPPELQKTQYEIAVNLINFLSTREGVSGQELNAWMLENKIANSTLRNLVIPKLVRVGILARSRRNPSGQGSKDERHPMLLSVSNRFGEALKHIGEEWTSLVNTWRFKQKQAQNQQSLQKTAQNTV